MKKLFTLFFLLAIHLSTTAQLIIYSEKFDAFPGYSIMGWTSTYSGVVPWQCGLPALVGGCMLPSGGPMSYTFGTNKVAAIADCGVMFDQNNFDVFSYTPPISLTGVSGAWLKYDSYFNKANNGVDTEKATVEISTDSGAHWTILQDVPASSPTGNFITHYIDLAAYNYAADIRIGFRYSDGGGWLQGWAIDNATVFAPARKDLALLAVTPTEPLQSYVRLGTGFTHHATVYNAGLDTIHSFILNYQRAGGPVMRDTLTGWSLNPFSTTDVTDAIHDSVFALGNFNVTMWVSLDSDAYHYNDTARTTLRGTNFTPTKRLAIESGEATWHSRTPRNVTYLNAVPSLDVDACIVSVHDADPMTDTPYRDFMFNLDWNYVPYIYFDRRAKVPLDSFFEYLNVQKNYFGFADIDLSSYLDGDNLSVSATITPAVDLSGDHRLALVVTEDTVRGDTASYNQANIYAGGSYGVMGGFETLPNPVAYGQMYYNHVGRQISSDPEGFTGCLPSTMPAGAPFDCVLNTTIDPTWRKDHLHAMVFLIRHNDSVILNSNKIPFPLDVKAPDLSSTNSSIYPNPANETTNVVFDLTHDDDVRISITDISGKMLYQQGVSHFTAGMHIVALPVQQFATGIYLVNVNSTDSHKTLKLEVLR